MQYSKNRVRSLFNEHNNTKQRHMLEKPIIQVRKVMALKIIETSIHGRETLYTTNALGNRNYSRTLCTIDATGNRNYIC